MYIPPHFAVPGKETLQKILPAASFATLITSSTRGIPVASHLPVSYDPDMSEFGTIYAHMARANTHWQEFDDAEVLTIFQGQHAYISPSFYATDINVPTWNYVAVHAYGVPKILSDPEETLKVLQLLTAENEQGMAAPWTTDNMSSKRLQGLMRAIVAFEIPITRLEGKAKLGQNKLPEDQASVKSAVGDLLE
ncbi:FMN-binding negative transcriptional regulator [Sneathiella marina]|uniref:FMN-binding negative transcriptional regulator n=1 Tax=Sneathiella marina TaxID=2950108 RepID=A0ABY4W4A3_9PROT|nr:FMN-binding negative transcriptional regulator [Sneathiella marina]USG61666.1 FMN-binding negative transcriptional regulator [Sneathiella marina]